MAGAVLETAGSIAENAETIANIATLVADITSLIFPSNNYQDTYIFSGNEPRVVSSGDRPDTVKTGNGPDDITTAGGKDNVDAGGGDNRVSTGKGDDVIRDGDGNSFLSAGADNDTIYPGGGSDVIQPGRGFDTIIFENNYFGNDLVIDTGGGGKLKFNLAAREDIELSKDGTDLKVTVKGENGEPTGSVKIVDYFSEEVREWVVEVIDGIIDLFAAVRGISANDAFELAMRAYDDDVEEYSRYLSPSLQGNHKETVDLNSTLGLRAEIFHINGDPRNLAISIRGTEASLTQPQDFFSYPSAGLTQAIALAVRLHRGGYLDDVLAVHITGHSLGGMVAQWVGTEIAAVTSAKFVNISTFNSVELSGIIETVLPFHLPLNILTGYSHIHTTHYIEKNDLVSRIGWWAGNGLGSTSYRSFQWANDPPDGANPFQRALHHHGPMKNRLDPATNIEIDSTTFELLAKSAYEKRLILKPSDLRSVILGVVDSSVNGAARRRTANAYEYLNTDNLADQASEIELHSSEYRNRVAMDSVPPRPFLRKFDFGPIGSIVKAGFTGVTPNDRHDGTANGIGYGWVSTQNLLAQDRGRADDLRRDYISTPDNTFVVETEVPGTFNIQLTIGDREMGADAIIREDMRIYVNGFYVDTVSTMPGQIIDLGFQVQTDISQLRISLKDQSGRSSRAVLNGMTIELVAPGTEAPETTVVQNDDSLIVITHGYTLPKGIGTVLDTIEATAKYIAHKAEQAVQVAIAFKKGGKVGAVLKAIELTLQDIKWILEQDFSSVRAKSPVHDWVFDMADQLALMSDKFRLGSLDTNVVPVDLSDTYATINRNDVTPDKILAHWEGSQDFLVLDWTRESNDGLGLLEFLNANPAEEAYRQGVNSAAKVYKALIEARVAKLKENDPNAKLDLLLISHGFGYNVNRELVEKLATSDIAGDLDYVKFQSLDPISMNPDELLGTSRESDRYYWYHPEFNGIVDQVENIYQTEGFFKLQGLLDPDSILNQAITVLGVTPAAPLAGAIRGSMLLVSRLVKDNAERIADALTYGKPLDGRVDGGNAGFFNGQARVFDLSTSKELLRFRHWDTDAINLEKGRLATELTDIEFSPDGKYIVSSGEDGIVTVRYAEDVPDPSTGGTTLLHNAGQPLYTIWGQDSWVRSIDFMEIEVEPGVRKTFILTLSSPNTADSNDADFLDLDRNKLLLTDLETGKPIWQGKDVGGTHVSASPSGDIIVTTDRNGNANVWRRNLELVTTFDKIGTVAAHPGGDGSRILDVIAVNDDYFITASVDETVRVFQIRDGDIARRGLPYTFSDKVRNLAYDPFNGLLAVGAGTEVVFYTFDQGTGTLLLELRRPSDHVKTVQGLAFTKPSFMLNENGDYKGLHSLPEYVFRAEGDLDRDALSTYLNQLSPSRNSLDGLRLVSGGEDRTLFLWNLSKQNWDIKNPVKESVLSGAMLPIREVAVTADGNRVAVVGQNNIDDSDGYTGGPVRDINATSTIDKRIGFHWSELFIGGVREHADVPYYYIEEVVQVAGEEWFWQRDNDALSRPGDLAPENNFAIPANKRDGKPGIDYVAVNAQVRPGKQSKLQPLKYLLEIDRDNYSVVQVLSQSMMGSGTINVPDANDQTVGTIRRSNADSSILVFEAATNLDFENETAYAASIPVTVRRAKGDSGAIEDITFDIIVTIRDYAPVIQNDLVEIYPERTRDIRPLNNDYDFEGDPFRLNSFEDKDLIFRGTKVGEIFRVTGEPGLVRVKATLTEAQFAALIAAAKAEDPDAPDSMEIVTTYDVKEDNFNARANGQIVTRIQLQESPENLTITELGADQFRLNWNPVGWTATKYVIERFDTALEQWVKHTETNDGDQESKLITGLTKTTAYTFRVVAKNTNNGRTVESSPLPVITPDYEAPRSVVPGSPAGATFIDVRWEKVFWDLGAYVVRLQRMRVDANGNPVFVNGDLQFDDFREVVIGANENANHRFKNLDPGTTFLASVYARRNSDNTQSPVRFAEAPTITLVREVPSAVAAERIGPEKMKVTWTPVTWNVQEYRIVVLDARTGEQVKKAKVGKNDTALIVDENLLANTDYLIFVDALDAKGNWISVLPEEGGNIAKITNNSAMIDLTGSVQNFAFASDLSGDVTIPTIAGHNYGANFSLLNLSTDVTRLVPPSGEQLFDVDSNQFADSITLHPALPNHVKEKVSYSITFLDKGVWEVKSTLDARVVTTPTYSETPVEPGTFQQEATTSSIIVRWDSPLWRVQSYRLRIYNREQQVRTRVVDSELNSDGLPRMDAHYEEIFSGLDPGTDYRFEITARGNTSARNGFLSTNISTLDLYSPSDLSAESIQLRSFDAKWNSVDWGDLEPTGYRVVVELKDGTSWESVTTRSTGRNATSVTIDGLSPAREYRFTVEANSDALGWLPNTNVKSVKTRSFDLPSLSLRAAPSSTRSIDLEWAAVYTTENADGYFFGADEAKVYWKGPDGIVQPPKVVSNGRTSVSIDNLERDTPYEVWVEFSFNDSNDVRRLSTADSTVRTLPAQAPVVSVDLESIQRHEFAVEWTHPDPQDVTSFTVEISFDGIVWQSTARKIADETFENRTNIPPGDHEPNQTYRRIVSHSRVIGDPKWLYFTAGRTYYVRVTANYNGNTPPQRSLAADPVTTAALPPPTDVYITEVGNSEMRVNWSMAETSGLEQFNVFKRATGTANWQDAKRDLAVNDRRALITDLEWGTEYEFMVEAVYVKASQTENEIRIREAASAISPPETTLIPNVELIDVRVDGKRKATVFWHAIAPAPNALRIEVQPFDSNGQPVGTWTTPEGGNILADTSRTSKEIAELLPGTTYEVRIVAISSAGGEIVSSNTKQIHTESYPRITGLDTNSPTLQGITVEWTRLESLDNDASVTKNVIEIFKDNVLLSNPPQTGSGSGNKHSLKLTGLEKGSTYEFRVVAYNGDVKLSESDRFEFSTLIDGLTVDEETAFSARANWTQFAGATATDYRVRVLLAGTNTVVAQKTVSVGSGLRRTTVDGLSPGQDYEMIVEVLRNQTVLSYSNRASFTTISAGLSGVTTTDVRRFSIDVVWNSVGDWANWTKVQWRKAGSSNWSGSGELGAARTTYSITGLDTATTYEIKVAANGNGIYDEVILARTTADFVKPSTPTFTAVGTREITVNWAHVDPAGPPDGFGVFRNGQKIADVGASVRLFRDTGLSPNTTYIYSIRAKYTQGNADSNSATKATLPVNYVAAAITSISNVRSSKVDVNWTFGGDMNEVESFTIHRDNTAKTQLGLTNPANFPGQTSFTKEISRTANARWWIFVRVRYKDGTVRESALVQLP